MSSAPGEPIPQCTSSPSRFENERNGLTTVEQEFTVRPQSPKQTYCSAPECQRERRRRWNRAKLEADPDYRANQLAALAAKGSASRRDLVVDCFGRHQPAAVVDASIAHLMDRAPVDARVEVQARSQTGSGRPATIYRLVGSREPN